ncbi:MAG: hypothetical protein JWM90_2555 [Thermoleophilia bacterium]|nr:hypothetical protein [Thermoleophilia bacterium]
MYNVMYMGALRTQIYLSEDQRAKIDELTARTGQSLAEVVRAALDAYLPAETMAEYRAFLDEVAGKYPDFAVPPRSEWDRGYG